MKIKTSLFYSLAAATLMSGVANAQSSATDPVGFHTLTAYGDGGSGDGRFSLISPGLVNPIEYASAATAITDTAISVDGTPFTANAFDPLANTDGGSSFYVEITDGDEAGAWANITTNDASSLTVDRDLSAAAGTSKIAIRAHVTLEDLFGALNEAGLQAGTSLGASDEITLFAGEGVAAKVYFFFDDGGANKGYATSGGLPAGNAPIEPQQGVYVKRKAADDAVFTRAGHVKVGPTKLNVKMGFNALAIPRAVGEDDLGAGVFTLDTSNLKDATDAANSVISGTSLAAADEVTVFLPSGGFGVFFHFDNNNGVAGWADGGGQPAGEFVLENGGGLVLKRKAADFVWTVPAEPIAN